MKREEVFVAVAFVLKTWTLVVEIFRAMWSSYGEHCNIVVSIIKV